MDLLYHLGKQHADQVVRSHQAEMTFAGRRVEHRLGSDRRLDRQQHFTDGFGKLLRVRRWLHFTPHLHQQFVFEIGSQASQYPTGGGLRQVQAFGGTGDVLLFKQYIECDQQVQVQVVETHQAYPLLYLFSRYIPVNSSSRQPRPSAVIRALRYRVCR
ncbi:hypothetical protein D3C85_1383580 [compost metagenome]